MYHALVLISAVGKVSCGTTGKVLS